MTSTRRIIALTVLAAAALSLGAGTATAATAHTRHVNPPVTVEQCEEGGGWVAVDIRTRRLFCAGGEFDDHYVD
ncbi:hypothetical protein [Kitasatospora sp. NPDC093102]|uniref:hypothetical protein n=1 Tax=Kitasatospora sp. NPDC093102 TaxID=3155069 RepID=UPI0034479E60